MIMISKNLIKLELHYLIFIHSHKNNNLKKINFFTYAIKMIDNC